jgi:hypothetical protein
MTLLRRRNTLLLVAAAVKCLEAAAGNRLAHLRHKMLIEMQIVHGIQMRTQDFIALIEMV